ncbi:hypothetical protein ACFLZ2_00585 [Candidatus Margulisiibacteriota bacterium]
MAEEEINPQTEGMRIVKQYISELGWSRELKRNAWRQLIPSIEKDPKLRHGDQMEEDAEGKFAAEVDNWRRSKAKEAKEVLRVILEHLRKRSDLGFFGKRTINRIKEDLAE